MERHFGQISVIFAISAGLWVVIGMAAPVQAGVDVNINIGAPPVVVAPPPPVVVAPPPPVEVEMAPEMIYLPEAGVYVAVGIPFDLYFVSGRYYYFHGGSWYWGRGYGGPWTHVVYRSLPPGLQRYKMEHLRQYREREYKAYKAQGPRFNGKHFVAVEGHRPNENHHMNGHDQGRHNGR
ncbi:MAG TPA: hypothetical protein VML36_07690 [Nitrospiria bacterium]|nr:hypothetical protein [Nitrospiria bacterium]